MLEDLDSTDSGHLIVQLNEGDGDKWLSGYEALALVEQHQWLEKRTKEATPILLPAHKGKPVVSFPSLRMAVDAWKGNHDAHALQRREEERFEQAGPGRGQSTDADRLGRRKAQQEKALSGFGWSR